jgi:phosphonate transport system substrate-binding protein
MKKTMVKMAVAVLLTAVLAIPSSVWAGPEQWPAKIRLGLIPTEGGSETKERFEPLVKHLEKCLCIEVEAVSASDYAGIITAMSHNHLDFAYYGPKSYTEAAEKANAEALVMERNKKGEPGYYGIIITRQDSGIKTMEDARGRVFTFTDPNSTSGFLVPNILFARELKTAPEDYFKQVKFSGSHGASILAVKNMSIDVAATNNLDLDRMIEKGQVSAEDFRILWKSDLIPGSPIAARKDLPASLKTAVTGALVSFSGDKAGLEKLQNGGFIYANDTNYDVIRYLKRLKKELAKKD